eukprot:g6351.t1
MAGAIIAGVYDGLLGGLGWLVRRGISFCFSLMFAVTNVPSEMWSSFSNHCDGDGFYADPLGKPSVLTHWRGVMERTYASLSLAPKRTTEQGLAAAASAGASAADSPEWDGDGVKVADKGGYLEFLPPSPPPPPVDATTAPGAGRSAARRGDHFPGGPYPAVGVRASGSHNGPERTPVLPPALRVQPRLRPTGGRPPEISFPRRRALVVVLALLLFLPLRNKTERPGAAWSPSARRRPPNRKTKAFLTVSGKPAMLRTHWYPRKLTVSLPIGPHLCEEYCPTANFLPASFGVTDERRILVHTRGGWRARQFYQENSSRVHGVVYMGAGNVIGNALAGANVPAMVLRGFRDPYVPAEALARSAHKLPKDFETVVVEGGNHRGFVSYTRQPLDWEATISEQEQRRLVVEALVDFIGRKMR